MDERGPWTGLPDRRWVVVALLLGIVVALYLLGFDVTEVFREPTLMHD